MRIGAHQSALVGEGHNFAQSTRPKIEEIWERVFKTGSLLLAHTKPKKAEADFAPTAGSKNTHQVESSVRPPVARAGGQTIGLGAADRHTPWLC